MPKKKTGILGAGSVGQALAAGFVQHDYPVMIGTSTPEKLRDWNNELGNVVKLGSMEEAANFGEIIVLAVKGAAADVVVKNVAGSLSGKTVLDTTNPIADAAPENGVVRFTTDLNLSLMEKLQIIAPDANFVKAFSCVGSHLMVKPKLSGKPSMFIAGNKDIAKMEATSILNLFGWEVEDMGMATSARAIEPLCMLWCIPGFIRNEWGHAFKLIKVNS